MQRSRATAIDRIGAVARALAGVREPDDMARVVLQQAVASLDGDSGGLVTVDGAGTLHLVAFQGVERDRVERYRSLVAGSALPVVDAVRFGEPVWLTSTADRDARYPHLAGMAGSAASVAFPLVAGDATRAAVVVGFSEPRAFDEDDRFFVRTLAHLCALALGRSGAEPIDGAALDVARVGVGADGRVTAWSSGATRLLGWAASNVVGRPFHDLVPDDRRGDALQLLALATLLAEPVADFTCERLDADGARVVVVASYTPAGDETIATGGIDVVLRPRTGTSSVRDERAATDALEADANGGAGSLAWDLRRATGRWSHALETIVGADTVTFPRRVDAFLVLVHREDRDDVARAVSRALGSGAPVDMEFRLLHDDGAPRYVRAVMYVAVDEGRATWAGLAAADVTERRLRLEAANEAEHRARTGTWTVDLRAGTFTASPEHARILGLTGDEHEHVIDEFDAMVHDDDRARWQQARAALEHGATIRGLAARITARDGYERYAITDVEPEFDDDGRVVRLHGTTRDVTEERALEALAREHETVDFLQRALLPDALPDFAGFDIAARYVPAGDGARVGGDWYDAFVTRDGRLALAVGDVAGHGVQTTAGMAQMRHAMRAYAFAGHAPGETLALLDALVTALAPDAFATAALFVCSPDGEIAFARAGHPYPLLADAGGVRALTGGARPPLGAGPKPPVEERVVLAPGATLVLYSDGLVEQRGVGLDAGIATLVQAVGEAATPAAGAADCANALLGASPGGRSPRDDVCLVVVRRHAASA